MPLNGVQRRKQLVRDILKILDPFPIDTIQLVSETPVFSLFSLMNLGTSSVLLNLICFRIPAVRDYQFHGEISSLTPVIDVKVNNAGQVLKSP